jgi:hypothetical protein
MRDKLASRLVLKGLNTTPSVKEYLFYHSTSMDVVNERSMKQDG